MEKSTLIINQIDTRTQSKEYDNFMSLKNRLIKIRGKLLHHERLSSSDISTLENENFYLG